MFLQTHELTRIFPMGKDQVLAVDHVNLDVEEGDFIALMGPSGSGKSSLLYLLGGLDRPTQGAILVGGADITRLSERALAEYRNKTVGFVFQDFYLQEHLDILENIELPLKFRGVNRGERQRQARILIERVGLTGRISHRPAELSGGERQRVAIARALSASPKLLLADEPTGNLDSKTGLDIVHLLVELNHTGITMMVVTHNPEVAQHARKIFTIQDGRIRQNI